MARALSPCSDSVKERWYAVLRRVHPEYEAGVRKAAEDLKSGTIDDYPGIPVTSDTPVRVAE